MAVYERLQRQQPHFYHGRIFKLMPRTGEMHQCVQKLTCKIITLSWNKKTYIKNCNDIMTFNLYGLENLVYGTSSTFPFGFKLLSINNTTPRTLSTPVQNIGLFKMNVRVQLSSGNSTPNSGNNHHLTIPFEGGMHSFKRQGEKYESEPPLKPSPLTCYEQFGTNSIIVLMFVESQRVHI